MPARVLLSPPDVGEREEELVLDALRSGWVAPAGPHLARFEAALADRTGRAYAVALSSGTAALHLALLTTGTRPGDVVVVPTLTFAATANAVVYTGAEPCFVDVEEATGNLDVDAMRSAVARLRGEGRNVSAVIPVDLFGTMADYDNLMPAAEELALTVIEDAAEALGSVHPAGASGSFGAVGTLSFNGNKVMTTSGGGAVVTDDAGLADKVRYLSTQARDPVRHYEHREIGYNYRLSNVLAALGVAQLERLDSMIARRRSLRRGYETLFADVPGARLIGGDDPYQEENCWLSVLIVDEAIAGWTAAQLAEHLDEHGIESRPVWKPMHLQPVHADRLAELTGAAERLFDHGLVLPGGSAHDEATIERIMGCVRSFLGGVQ